MIKLTVKQLVEAATGNQSGSALSRFFALDKPVAVAWQNRGQIKACTDEMKLYEERRLALCEKHGTKNESSSQFTFDVEGTKNFTTEMNELLKQEVELPGTPVKIASLNGRVSESDLSLIEPFLTD